MATTLTSPETTVATVPLTPTWVWRRGEVLAQLLVTGGPLLVGSLFPIGKPVYPSLFGPLGQFNCLSYLIFHRPCPACGLTSGVVSLLHGRLDLSVGYHPLGWAFTLLFVIGFIGALLKLRRLMSPTLPAPGRIEAWLLTFPAPSLLNALAIGFIALAVGRFVFWMGEVA